METILVTDFTAKYECANCLVICKRKSEWERHILTRKHILSLSGNHLEMNLVTKTANHICCNCDKKYSTILVVISGIDKK